MSTSQCLCVNYWCLAHAAHVYTQCLYYILLVLGVMLLQGKPLPTRCTVLRISDFVPYMPRVYYICPMVK